MRELTQLPWGDAMLLLARSVVDSQLGIDLASHRAAAAIMAQAWPSDGDAARPVPPLAELGIVPVFYQLAETLFDVAISVGIRRAERAGAGPSAPGRLVAVLTPVAADSAALYGIGGRHAARLRFRILPVPAANQQLLQKRLADMTKQVDSAGPADAGGERNK